VARSRGKFLSGQSEATMGSGQSFHGGPSDVQAGQMRTIPNGRLGRMTPTFHKPSVAPLRRLGPIPRSAIHGITGGSAKLSDWSIEWSSTTVRHIGILPASLATLSRRPRRQSLPEQTFGSIIEGPLLGLPSLVPQKHGPEVLQQIQYYFAANELRSEARQNATCCCGGSPS
jgi:hypothetical protein